MKITKKDWAFIALVVVVLAIFIVISGREKTKKVPFDDTHKVFYQKAENGLPGQKEADLGCPQCHNNEQGGIPFPAKHPVKPSAGPMSCHLCHKYDRSKL